MASQWLKLFEETGANLTSTCVFSVSSDGPCCAWTWVSWWSRWPYGFCFCVATNVYDTATCQRLVWGSKEHPQLPGRFLVWILEVSVFHINKRALGSSVLKSVKRTWDQKVGELPFKDLDNGRSWSWIPFSLWGCPVGTQTPEVESSWGFKPKVSKNYSSLSLGKEAVFSWEKICAYDGFSPLTFSGMPTFFPLGKLYDVNESLWPVLSAWCKGLHT